jgi:hypothetical protein
MKALDKTFGGTSVRENEEPGGKQVNLSQAGQRTFFRNEKQSAQVLRSIVDQERSIRPWILSGNVWKGQGI